MSEQDGVVLEFEKPVKNLEDQIEELKGKDLEKLLEKKMAGEELDKGPRIDEISAFIERELARLEQVASAQKPVSPPVEDLNEFFRWSLSELWQ